ncbi:Chromobox -like protein 3 [Halotydeus destructor]|nr:Chromobox -like protein 3 [Halotydeus destructor]
MSDSEADNRSDKGSGDGQAEEEEFQVERIIKKRVRGGVVEYFLKWKGYEESDNTWEPRDNLNCEDLIEAFEKQEREKQKKVKEASGGATASSTTSKRKGGDHEGSKNKSKKTSLEEEKGFARGLEPDKIIGATDSSGELMFLLKWKDSEEADLVPAKIANDKCPQTVIQFYEERLTWHSKNNNAEDD